MRGLCRATAERLNVRVSDLVAAEVAASSQTQAVQKRLEAASQDAERTREQHARELAEAEAARGRLRATLATTQPTEHSTSLPERAEESAPDVRFDGQVPGTHRLKRAQNIPVRHSPPPIHADVDVAGDSEHEGATHAGGSAGTSEREALLKKTHIMARALEDAEVAVAALQRKLAAAEEVRAGAQRDARDVRREADAMKAGLEQQVRAATQDGALRVRLLEETVEKLGRRGDAAAEIARLSVDVSRLQRSEARLRSDLAFAESRAEALMREVAAAGDATAARDGRAMRADAERVRAEMHRSGCDAAGAVAVLGEADALEHERRGHRELVAKLAERAERAEVELGRAEGQVAALREQVHGATGAQARGTGAIITASKALEARAGNLERDALVKGARCRTMQETLQLREAEGLRLQQQLADASREVAAARTRVADAERRAHDADELYRRSTLEARAQSGMQRTQLLARVTQAESAAAVRSACSPTRAAASRFEAPLGRSQSHAGGGGACARQSGAAAQRGHRRGAL